MMKIALVLGMALAMLWGMADAQVQRESPALQLKDQARACYLTFFKLFDADYYRTEDGVQRRVKLNSLREFSPHELPEAPR